MAFLRHGNRDRFTVIDNEAIRDDNLSLKGLGLLVKLISLPDNWEFSENGLEAIFKHDGQTSIRSGIKELEKFGYLKRQKVRDEKGRISKVEWVITENPHRENPHFENPSMDNPNLGNQPQYNTKEPKTKETNTKEQNTPYNPPEGEGTQDFKSLLDAFKADVCNTDNQHKEEKLGFDDWYSHYPRKQARQRAEKAWKKIKPDQKLIKRMIDAVEVMKTKESWTKDNGQYIPLPATWLNDGRWEDEEAQPPEKHHYELLFDDNDTIEERFFGDKVKVKVIKDD